MILCFSVICHSRVFKLDGLRGASLNQMIRFLYKLFGKHWHDLVPGFGCLYIDSICITCGKRFSGVVEPFNATHLEPTQENMDLANKVRMKRFSQGYWT